MVWAQPSKSAQDRGWIELSKQSITVQIQAATRVEMQVQRNRAGRPEITGQLLDDQGKGIPRAPLVLQLPDKREIPLQTNEQGRFRKEVKNFPPKGVFALRFPGRSGFRQSQIRRDLDLGRVDATFSAVFPPALPSGTKRFIILANLHYQKTPLSDYTLQLFLGRLTKESPKPSVPFADRPKDTPPRTCKDLGVPVMTLKTDAKGRVRFVWQGPALEGPAKIPLCLMLAGDRYFLPQDRRYALQILAPSPQPPQTPWLWIGAFSAFALGLGAFVFLRRKPPNNAPPKAQALAAEDVLRSHDNEAITAQRGVRPPQDRVFAGRLIDLYEQKAIHDAAICLQQGEEEKEVARSRRDGSFHWQAPDDLVGPVTLWVRHPAFREKSIQAPCPHYGEARGLHIGLYSYRYLCLEAFRQGVESLQRSFNPRKQTAREILELLPKHLAHLLRPLAVGFEHAYYAPKHPSKELYQHVSIALKGLLQQDSSLLPALSLLPNYEEHERLASQTDSIPLKPLPPPTPIPPPPSLKMTAIASPNRTPTPEPPTPAMPAMEMLTSPTNVLAVSILEYPPSEVSLPSKLSTPSESPLFSAPLTSSEMPLPSELLAPSETSVPSGLSALSETLLSSDVSAPSETSLPSELSAPTETPLSSDVSIPSETPLSSDVSTPSEAPLSSHTMELLEEEIAPVRAAAAAFEELQRRDRAHHTLQLSSAERDAFFAALLATSPESAIVPEEQSGDDLKSAVVSSESNRFKQPNSGKEG